MHGQLDLPIELLIFDLKGSNETEMQMNYKWRHLLSALFVTGNYFMGTRKYRFDISQVAGLILIYSPD